jgi:hypothetical protein
MIVRKGRGLDAEFPVLTTVRNCNNPGKLKRIALLQGSVAERACGDQLFFHIRRG